MSVGATCPGANATELYHDDMVTGARYSFMTFCDVQAVMGGDIAAAASDELSCQAACINANQGLATMACQGVTYSDAEGCVLHTSNDYWSQPRDGFNSFWLHEVMYAEHQDPASIVSEDRVASDALASAAANESPSIQTITAEPHAIRALVTSWTTSWSSDGPSSTSSTSWSRTITSIVQR